MTDEQSTPPLQEFPGWEVLPKNNNHNRSNIPKVNFCRNGVMRLNMEAQAYLQTEFVLLMIDPDNNKAALKPITADDRRARKITRRPGRACVGAREFCDKIGMTSGHAVVRWNEAEGVLEWDTPKPEGGSVANTLRD